MLCCAELRFRPSYCLCCRDQHLTTPSPLQRNMLLLLLPACSLRPPARCSNKAAAVERRSCPDVDPLLLLSSSSRQCCHL